MFCMDKVDSSYSCPLQKKNQKPKTKKFYESSFLDVSLFYSL